MKCTNCYLNVAEKKQKKKNKTILPRRVWARDQAKPKQNENVIYALSFLSLFGNAFCCACFVVFGYFFFLGGNWEFKEVVVLEHL